MSLHSLVRGAIGAINPDETVTISASTGYAKLPGGKREPSYADAIVVVAQVQPLQGDMLRAAEGLNIQGERLAVYLDYRINPAIRDEMKGGDLVTRHDGTQWLVASVTERWPGWTAAIMVRQVAL